MTNKIAGSIVAVVVVVCARPTAAEVTKTQCVAANGNAQSLRRDGKLSEARELLRMCSSPKCPNLVAADCTKRLDELELAQPTVVFDVKDGAGRDLSAIKVTMDGRPLLDKLDGTPLPVDPGEHVFTFTSVDQTSISQRLVLREGDKGRRESVVLGLPPPSPSSISSSISPSIPSSEAATTGWETQKTLGFVAGGIGIAGIGVGGVFGLLTASAATKQKEACSSPTACSSYDEAVSAHANGLSHGTVSTIAFVAGGAFLATGIVLFLTAKPHATEPRASVALALVPSVGPGGAGCVLRGGF